MITTNTSLIKNLNFILKAYYPLGYHRTRILKDILFRFEEHGKLRYPLDNVTTLILEKDESRLHKLRKYRSSPFSYLSNVEWYSNSVGSWNQELLEFGLRIRSKRKHSMRSEDPGNRIHLIKLDNVNSRGNHYLRGQYKRLERYRNSGNYCEYWKLSFTLMSQSLMYQLASLQNWQPRWYKNYSVTTLVRLFKGLNRILHLRELKTTLKNVWIESPKGKYRQLNIPPLSWRLYLHMQNMFLSYLYSPRLSSEIYDGFLYERGCKSWWETVLWGPILKNYNCLIELDFSSGFPNLNLHTLRRALLSDGLIPPNIINLFLTILKSDLKESQDFPTLESYIENESNRSWRNSDRSLPMGLGISPIFYVITLDWCIRQLPLMNTNIVQKWYADDGSIYFNSQWILSFLKHRGWLPITWDLLSFRNPILHWLNTSSIFQEAGLRICPQKSSWVRFFGLWIKPYQSLGLRLEPRLSLIRQLYQLLRGHSIPMRLRGSTRGRGPNPVTGRPGSPPSNHLLEYAHNAGLSPLDLDLMLTSYKPYWGVLLSKLYNPLEKCGYTYKFVYKPNSLLGYMKPHQANKTLPPLDRFTIYNSGSKSLTILIGLLTKSKPHSYSLPPSLKRKFSFDWNDSDIDITTYKVDNPLNTPTASGEVPTDYFIKYSELKLSKSEFAKLQANYKRRMNKMQKPE